MEFHVHQSEDAIYKIYKLTGPTGKIYIGCTKREPEKRWQKGKGYCRNRMMWADIEKYGWDAFEKVILCDNLLKEAADKLEDEFIQYYDSRNPDKGYNIFTGGSGKGTEMSALGIQHCRESRYELWSRPDYRTKQKVERKSRYAGNPEACKKMSLATKKAIDSEIRKKMSERKLAFYAAGNKPQTKSRPCYCMETGERFRSLTAAGKAYGVSQPEISRCCKGKAQTAGGYHWRFQEEMKQEAEAVL